MQLRTVLISLLAFCMSSTAVHADLTIIDAVGEPVPPENYIIAWDDAAQAYDIILLELSNPWGDTTYEIHGDGGESIDRLEVAVNGPTAGSPVIVRVISDGFPGLDSINEIVQTGTAEILLNRVEVNVDVGRVEVLAVGNIIAGRHVVGPITATTPSNAARGITLVQAGRDVLGDLVAVNGRIKRVIAGGDIGKPDQSIQIQAGHYIGRIEAEGDCFAQIDTTDGPGTGHIASLDVATFWGSIIVENLKYVSGYTNPGQLRFRERLEGMLFVQKSFRHEDLTTIETGELGIAGHIIFNAAADAACEWSAPVHIGDIGLNGLAIDGPGYTQTCEQLGGGTIGLVPFLMHDESCEPSNGGVIEQVGSVSVIVDIHFYGPLMSLEAMPVNIARRIAGASSAFEPVSDAFFDAQILTESPQVIRLTRAWMQPGFQSGYEYRITPRPSLHCLLPNSVPVASGQVYLVTVEGAGSQCIGDVDGDGQVGFSDFTQLLIEYGQSGPGLMADFDGNGSVDSLDFSILLVYWGPCETRSAAASPSRGARKKTKKRNNTRSARRNKGKFKRAQR